MQCEIDIMGATIEDCNFDGLGNIKAGVKAFMRMAIVAADKK